MENFLNEHKYSLSAPLLSVDSSGRVLQCNEAAQELAQKLTPELTPRPTGATLTGTLLYDLVADANALDRLLQEATAVGFALPQESRPALPEYTGEDKKAAPFKNKLYPLCVLRSDQNEHFNVILSKTNTAKPELQPTFGQSDKHELLKSIWYELSFSNNFQISLNRVLSVIGKSLMSSQVSVLELSENTSEFQCTQQWPPSSKMLQNDTSSTPNILPKELANILEHDGLLLGSEDDSPAEDLKIFMKNHSFSSILGVPLTLNHKVHGCLLCVNTEPGHAFSTIQAGTLLKLAEMISLGLSRHHNERGKPYDTTTLTQIISRLDSIIGVIDKKNQKVIFANEAFLNTTDFSALGQSCLNQLVVANKKHCPDCFLANKNFKGNFAKEVYLKNLKKWIRIIHGVMHWADGIEHILFSAEDVTASKLDKQRLRYGLAVDYASGTISADIGVELLQTMLDSRPAPECPGKEHLSVGLEIFIVVFRLEHYQTVMHSLGQKEIDAILKKLMATIKGSLMLEAICRLSENEFMILPSEGTNKHIFKEKLSELLSKLQNENDSDITRYAVETRFALTGSNDLGVDNAEDFIIQARLNLSRHKQNKSNQSNTLLL